MWRGAKEPGVRRSCLVAGGPRGPPGFQESGGPAFRKEQSEAMEEF